MFVKINAPILISPHFSERFPVYHFANGKVLRGICGSSDGQGAGKEEVRPWTYLPGWLNIPEAVLVRFFGRRFRKVTHGKTNIISIEDSQFSGGLVTLEEAALSCWIPV